MILLKYIVRNNYFSKWLMMRFSTIYLDNAATTRIDDKVLEEMIPYYTKHYGNASSLHSYGYDAKEAMDESRETISKILHSDFEDIIFTASGSEANNMAIKGLAFSDPSKKHIITTKIEHKSITNQLDWLATRGYRSTYLDVDKDGFINLEQLEKSLEKNKDTLLVSIIHGNNEIGTLQDLEKIGKSCKKYNVPFHIDACQSFTKSPIDVKKMNISLASINAHKIHGPKGVGALYVSKEIKLTPLIHGGQQEFKKRAATENIPGIVGFAKAAEINNSNKISKQVTKLRDDLTKGLEKIVDSKLNGPRGEKRLYNNVNFSFKGIEGEALGGYLDQKSICTSTGSACSSKSLEPSPVLRAIGLDYEDANSSLRMSVSKYNTDDEMDYTIKTTEEIIQKLRKISPIYKHK